MKSIRMPLSIFLLLCLLLALPVAAMAETKAIPEPDQTTPAETKPAPEWDLTPLPEEWFKNTLFIGDSITQVLQQYCDKHEQLAEMQIWSLKSLNVRNTEKGTPRFWYQGTAFSLLDLVKETGAEKLYFCLGINDIVREGGIDVTIERWTRICEDILKVNPDIELLFQSCFPMWRESLVYDLNNDVINRYNDRLRDFCAEKGYTFVDLADYFRGEDGSIAEAYSSDHYVHVSMEAAKIWVEQLQNPANYSVDPRSL